MNHYFNELFFKLNFFFFLEFFLLMGCSFSLCC